MKIKNLDAFMLRRVAQQLEMAANFKDMQEWVAISDERKRELLVSSEVFVKDAVMALVEGE